MTGPVILNNRYQIEERLGTGGMAVVYRARDQMLERPVAIKILRENFSDDPDFREPIYPTRILLPSMTSAWIQDACSLSWSLFPVQI
jgi:serine/threonine protein kinase